VIKVNSFIYFTLLIITLSGCGAGRNFKGSPFPFVDSNLDLKEPLTYNPEYLFGFQPKLEGFTFNIFQKSSNGYYGNSINFQVSMKNLRLSIGNIGSGYLDCQGSVDEKTCIVKWLSSAPFYSFDISKYILKFEIKPIVAVFKLDNFKNINLNSCTLSDGEDFLKGEKLTISLIETDTLVTKKIIHYDFGSNNQGSELGNILTNESTKNSYYYSFDFEKYFSSTAYYFDVYPTISKGEFNLYRIGARALDESIETLVHFCFYDKI
jgi:hypothetical protein